MKKLHYLMASLGLALAVVTVVPLASAQSCEPTQISNSGPGSINLIECDNKNTVEITCNNKATVTLNTDQVAQSGDVTIKGNTIAGTGVSGDSTNAAYENIDLKAVCAALVKEETPAPTPAPSPAPTPTPAPAPKPVVAALPYTSAGPTAIEKASLFAGAAAVAGAVIFGSVKLYAKFNS